MMSRIREEYLLEESQKTVKVGRLLCFIGIPVYLYFAFQDVYFIKLDGTLPWRALGLFPLVMFLPASYLDCLKKYPRAIVFHSISLLSSMIGMCGILYVVFTDNGLVAGSRSAAIGGMSVLIFCLLLFAGGARRYLAGIIFLPLAGLAILIYSHHILTLHEWTYFSNPILIAIAVVAMGHVQERSSFKEFQLRKRISDDTREMTEALAFNRQIFSESPVGYAVYEESGRCLLVNDSYAQIAGSTREHCMALNFHQIQPWKKAGLYATALCALEENSKKYQEAELVSTFGKRVCVECNFVPIVFKDLKCLMVTVVDVTGKKQAESERAKVQRQMYMASKLASIGELAAGVAHEVNNPLAIIQGNAELMSSRVEMEADLREPLQSIHGAAGRIRDIVNGLRVYARKDLDHLEQLSVHKVIEDTVRVVGAIYEKEGIRIVHNFRAKQSTVKANGGKLQQVIMNLLSNGRDAMPNGGTILIETAELGSEIAISVGDTGTGISAEDTEKIFEAFYTTKGPGRGTGLGLSIAQSIIMGFGGKITVNSQLGVGTTFSITLPLTKMMPSPLLPRQKEAFEKLSGKVLVVDDEYAIRYILRTMLETFGLEVEEANDGEDALGKLEANSYTHVFLDAKMPRMNGEAVLFEAKRRLNIKGTKFIMITGGITGEDPSEQSELKELLDGFIRKPFSRRDLYDRLSGKEPLFEEI